MEDSQQEFDNMMEQCKQDHIKLMEQHQDHIKRRREKNGFDASIPKRYYKFTRNKHYLFEDRDVGDEIKLHRKGEMILGEVVEEQTQSGMTDCVIKVKSHCIRNNFLWGDILIVNQKYLFPIYIGLV